MKILKNIIWLTALVVLAACEVSDVIPYPTVYGQITEFEVEGQCNADGGSSYSTAIDKENRRVTIYVTDTVNLARLRVTKLTASGISYNPDVDYKDTPVVLPDSAACEDYSRFPKYGITKPTPSQNTVVDFRDSVNFIVRTYQDYKWIVDVKQVIKNEIELENQVGNPVIDTEQRNIVVNVSRNQDLRKVKVKKFQIGGEHATVNPNPLKTETFDFLNLNRFIVLTGWGEIQVWNVIVSHSDAAVEASATAFTRNTSMTISGNKPNGSTPSVMYRRSDESLWHAAPQSAMTLTATTYTVTIKGLQPGTKYLYKVEAGSSSVSEQETTTLVNQQLPNSSFDEWSTDASNNKLVCPWALGGTQYWDTGNRGATTVGNSNSVFTDDTSTGSGKAAFLESKYIVIKFAAGSIFTGKYLKTEGTNGVLGFGRPFKGFPTRMTFDYKYNCATIDRIGDNNYSHLKGKPDIGQVYIALWHIEEGQEAEYQGEKYPLIIRTKPGADQSLFSKDDPRVIAYAQMSQDKTVSDWTSETLTLEYKNTTQAPTHILVVASSSKYGDFFVGGVGSALTIDNTQLHYD